MPRIVTKVPTPWTPEEAFAYMADFSHSVEWDPGVVGASRVDTGAVGLGSAFDLTVRIGPRRLTMRYEIAEYEPGRVTFRARTSTLESADTVTVVATDGATQVTYDAGITFRGLLRLANPLLALGFRGVVRRAGEGLERRLSSAA